MQSHRVLTSRCVIQPSGKELRLGTYELLIGISGDIWIVDVQSGADIIHLEDIAIVWLWQELIDKSHELSKGMCDGRERAICDFYDSYRLVLCYKNDVFCLRSYDCNVSTVTTQEDWYRFLRDGCLQTLSSTESQIPKLLGSEAYVSLKSQLLLSLQAVVSDSE